MTDDIRTEAVLLYDRFTHGAMERRDFMARMVALTGSVAAANLLIGTIAAKADAAPRTDPREKRLTIGDQTIAGTRAYVAEPRTRSLKPTVLVVHENRGLNEHTRDVARRVALAGYRAVAADFLTPLGGTPADEDKARDMIGKLDLAATTRAGVAMLADLARSSRAGKVGAVGFCWGGAYVGRLAVAAGKALGAGVIYYGPQPDPAEASKVEAPLLFHLAGLDDRVAATAWPFVAALGKAGKTLSANNYAGVNHAFNNDTSAERYDKAAADLAWKRTLDFLGLTLG